MGGFVRLANKADSEAILGIYAPYIQNSAISFESEVPALEEFASRVESISRQYPYLVYVSGGNLVGFAYASRHREREAYRYGVDVSIYVLPTHQGTGAAHQLYKCLFALLGELGYCVAYAAYTVPNEKSRLFHQKFGFTPIGVHRKTGYKLGQWHDVAWLEKSINSQDGTPPPIKGIGDLSGQRLAEIISSRP